MSDRTATVALRGVSRSYGDQLAVDNLDLMIPRGSIYGILGPNGSGKTTTLRMLLGLLEPDAGLVWLLGGKPDASRRKRVAYLPEHRSLSQTAHVSELITYFGQLRGLSSAEARHRCAYWLERFQIAHTASRQVKELSKGTQQKVQFVAAILNTPDLLVLDEPFSGLDPVSQVQMEDVLREMAANGAAVLLSTHAIAEAERLLDRVCVLVRGRKVLDGAVQQLRNEARTGIIEVAFAGDDRWLRRPEIASIEKRPDCTRIRLQTGVEPAWLLSAAVRQGVPLRRWEEVLPSLHEVVVQRLKEAR